MSARRTAQVEAAHARAVALKGPRWRCHVPGCGDPGPHPAATVEAAERAAMGHYDRAHHDPDPPADLEARRAAWVRAGRPPLGDTRQQRTHDQPC